jgi:hypothetical protein
VQGRRRRNQPERLVPAVRQEDLELLDRQSCAPKRRAIAHAIKGSADAAYWRDDALERRRSMMEAWGRFCVPAKGRQGDSICRRLDALEWLADTFGSPDTLTMLEPYCLRTHGPEYGGLE